MSDYCEIERVASEYGYPLDENLFDIRHAIGLSYIDYLQKTVPGIDFKNTTFEERPDVYSCTEYAISTSFDTVSVDVIMEKIRGLEDEVHLFDYGCGKG